MIVINKGTPFWVVCSIAHEQCRACHVDGRAQTFISNQAACSMHSGAPVVRTAKAPFKNSNLNSRMRGIPDEMVQLYEVIGNALYAGLKVLRFIFIIVTT